MMTSKGAPLGIESPHDDASLWRFMGLAKMLSMLQTQSLYLARVDTFSASDPFEGSFPALQSGDFMWRRAATRSHDAYRNRDIGIGQKKSENRKEELKNTFINCWFAAEYDSDAMWKIYGGAGDGSVAIKTKFGIISNLLPDWTTVGKISYGDKLVATNPSDDIWLPFFRKRRCFEHEQELRIIAKRSDIPDIIIINDFGVKVSIDVKSLITEVRVSPGSAPWFMDVVRTSCADAGLKCAVDRAPMDSTPYF